MPLSKEAEEQKPKKPLNAYMRFRNNRMKELGDAEGKNNTVKQEWENMKPEELDKIKKQVDNELIDYEKKLKEWKKKFNIQEEDEKRKKSKERKSSPEEKKNDKSKGDRKKKEEKGEKAAVQGDSKKPKEEKSQ